LKKNNRYENNNEGPIQLSGLTVNVRNDDFPKALRLFKKKVQQNGVIQEVRDREYYVKPSEKRKKAKAAGRARWLKKQAKADIHTKRLF
jgi:small subunit ribosomal protein S21